MSNRLIEDLEQLLKSAELSAYEIKAYLSLLNSNHLTAREISIKSNVPSGRIYEVLEELKMKGLIEIQDSRPKMYRALNFNPAFNNLISHLNNQHKRKTDVLTNEAKILESRLYESDLLIKKEPSRIFWSTVYGAQSIISMYMRNYNELQEELLLNDFINESTLKILPYGRKLFEGIIQAINRGVQVKLLWSFEHDDRPLTEKEKEEKLNLYNKIVNKLREMLNINSDFNKKFEMRFIYKKIPTNYDLFDKKRIMFKLQNPLQPFQIFACMNVLDQNLAEKLREKYLSIWTFEAINLNT